VTLSATEVAGAAAVADATIDGMWRQQYLWCMKPSVSARSSAPGVCGDACDIAAATAAAAAAADTRICKNVHRRPVVPAAAAAAGAAAVSDTTKDGMWRQLRWSCPKRTWLARQAAERGGGDNCRTHGRCFRFCRRRH